MHRETKDKDIIKIQKELGYFKSSNPAKHLSFNPRELRRLGVRVVRKGIHEARKINKVADFIDETKLKIYTKKSLVPKKTEFKKYRSYEVSIVIPVYNKISYTLNCLSSICNQVSGGIKYQIIVVDNASSDATEEQLTKIDGITYIKNKKNLGFVGACNQGAKASKGKYIVFLNNDTSVQEGWLESLLVTIKKEGVGLVGSKLVYPTKRLQEAGGIIFRDGSGYNYGRNEWPHMYQYNYVREVDYCSGASIIISKSLFFKLGGFDNLYAPAYYEDTDLAFSVRKAGYKVVYQPKSVIFHIEGGTAGTDLSSGFKKYQSINKIKFEKKWKKELRKQYSPEDLFLARDKSSNKFALIVDENLPKPDEDSGSVRMYRMIEIINDLGYKVTFFPYNTTFNNKYSEPLQQLGVEIVYGPEKVDEFVKKYGKYFDVVILSRPRIAALFMDLCVEKCTNAKIIYDTVDLHYLRLTRKAEFDKHPKRVLEYAKKHEILEKHLMTKADTTLVVSDMEKKILDKDGVKNVRILSNIHQIDEESYNIGFKHRKDLLFVGGYAHPPNIDGIRWFVNDIFPLIRKKLPNIKINVVGSHMPTELRRELSTSPGVVVHGYIDNLEPVLKSSRVFVAPLRFGAGVKGKIGQAIEFGIPVVSTGIGIEGMKLVDNESCIIADDAKSFADSVINIYKNEKQWKKLQINQRAVLDKYFSVNKTKAQLSRIV